MKRSSILVTASVLALTGGAALWLSSRVSLGQKTGETAPGPEVGLPTVVTILPRVGDVEETLRIPAGLEPYEVARLQPKVSGFLAEVRVDIGDEVKKDDLLAKLDIPEMEPELEIASAEVAAAEARLEKAEADAELAIVTHERVAELHAAEPGAISRQDVDIAAAEARVAGANVRVVQSEVRLARSRRARLEVLMAYAEIRAPFDGRVTKRLAHTGALMGGEAADSPAIVEVVRTDKLRLVFEIPEVAVPHVGEGREVDIALDALPGESFRSRISRLSGALEPHTRNRRVEIDLDPRGGKLLPGMYATVRLDLRSFEGSITLPAQAIHKTDGHVVYTVDNGQVALCPVAILMDNGADVVVTGKLGPETPVVVSMPRRVKAGDRVREKPAAE